jgi:hypothetical protein
MVPHSEGALTSDHHHQWMPACLLKFTAKKKEERQSRRRNQWIVQVGHLPGCRSPVGHIGWTNRVPLSDTLVGRIVRPHLDRACCVRPSVRGERPFCEAGYTWSPTEGELKTPPLPLRRTCTMARVAALKERVLAATGRLSFYGAPAPPPRVSLHASFMRGAVTGRIHSSGSVLTRLAARGRASQTRILATRGRSGSRRRCRASKAK